MCEREKRSQKRTHRKVASADEGKRFNKYLNVNLLTRKVDKRDSTFGLRRVVQLTEQIKKVQRSTKTTIKSSWR